MLVNLGVDPAIGCFFRPNCTGRIDEGVTFDDSYELTMEAFDFCDSDEDGCLTWKEIEPCEVRRTVHFVTFLKSNFQPLQDRFCKLLTVECPNEENFHQFDLNGDGSMCPDEYDQKFRDEFTTESEIGETEQSGDYF